MMSKDTDEVLFETTELPIPVDNTDEEEGKGTDPVLTPAPAPAQTSTRKTANQEALAAIIARRRQQSSQDKTDYDSGAMFGERVDSPQIPYVEGDTSTATDGAEEIKTDEFVAPQPTNKVKLNLDGAEVEVTPDEIVQQYRVTQELNRQLSEAKKLIQEGSKNSVQNEPPPAAPAAPADDIDQFLDSVSIGENDEAKEKLKNILDLNKRDVYDKVKTDIREELRREEVNRKFSNEYTDILSDPLLVNVADKIAVSALSQGLSYADALEKAGKETREWLKSKTTPVQESAKPDTKTVESRAKRKESIDTIPAANARQANTSNLPKTRADVLAEMRKGRNQPEYIR